MPTPSADDLDNTDELPVLLETVALEEPPEETLVVPAPHGVTPEHAPIAATPAAMAAEPLGELRERAERVAALEAQVHLLADGARDLERSIAEKDQRLRELNDALRRAVEEAAAADRQHAAQLAVRDAQLAELLTALERQERDAAASAADVELLREAADAAQRDADASRAALAQPAAEAPAPSLEKLREDYASLESYVAGRRAWWDELQATNAGLAERVTALERELASGAKRLATAEAFAARESQRAVALRDELVAYARRVDALERELKAARAVDAQPPARSADALEPIAVAETPLPIAPAGAPPATPAAAAEIVEALAPGIEAIAQLEAEVEYKRQQVAAQLVELRERDQRLRGALVELGALRGELEDSRSHVARLERAVADKDRALEVRDARIATLHDELKERAAGIELRGAAEFPPPPLDTSLRRPTVHDAAADGAPTPTLICLTGDAPRRFALTKKTITVGRGPHCDLQILTHFVSREHARLTSNAGATLIEDLGSRNGVYVNAVRVDRQHLQQGDLVTIGETQFRFVESMAH
jgi:hypothetical protein